jgi:hypothetical protein
MAIIKTPARDRTASKLAIGGGYDLEAGQRVSFPERVRTHAPFAARFDGAVRSQMRIELTRGWHADGVNMTLPAPIGSDPRSSLLPLHVRGAAKGARKTK